MTSEAKRTSVHQVLIQAPIEAIWSELVNNSAPRPFFFGAKMDTTGLIPGNPMAMRTPNGRYTSVVGEVTAFEPPYLFAHTFRFTTLAGDTPAHVTYNLEEKDGGVLFTLTSAVPAGEAVSKTEKQMAQGGAFIVNNLKALVETGKPTFGGRLLLGLIAVMTPFTPKEARSENWPLDASRWP